MTRKIAGTLAVVFGLLVLALPALAHHAASAEFDAYSPITIKGTINHVDWINPHVYIWLDVKAADGKMEAWSFEATNPRALRTAGITREDFKTGQVITMTGILAKDKTKNFAWMRQASFADGHTVTAWPATENGKFNDNER